MSPVFIFVLVVILSITYTVGYPAVQKPPMFSFETIPVFAHVTKTTPYNETELDFLTKFQIVQFDKKQGRRLPLTQEERFIEASKQIKNTNPKVFTLMYYNSAINFPEFSLYNKTLGRTDLLVSYPNGSFAPFPHLAGMTAFDLSNPEMRDLIIKDCMEGIKSSFDGCFFDRGDWAREMYNLNKGAKGWTRDMFLKVAEGGEALFKELQGNVTEDHIILAKETASIVPEDWKNANAMMLTDTFCSEYGDETKYNPDQCVMDITAAQGNTKRKQLTQIHVIGLTQDDFEFGLATYLVSMGELSYFSYQDKRFPWSLTGLSWHKEYDNKLGEPKSDATKNGYIYTRSFASGTTVWVDVKNRNATITWGK